MSEQELNKYRFSPDKEPTDEMLGSGRGSKGKQQGRNRRIFCANASQYRGKIG